MNINTKKLRFYLIVSDLGNYYQIKAKRKTSGKYEVIGSCHAMAKQAIVSGQTELIKWNFQLQTI